MNVMFVVIREFRTIHAVIDIARNVPINRDQREMADRAQSEFTPCYLFSQCLNNPRYSESDSAGSPRGIITIQRGSHCRIIIIPRGEPESDL